jgi:integrase
VGRPRYERRSGGYSTRVWVVGHDGSRKQIRVSAKTSEEMRDKLAALRVASKTGTIADAGRLSTAAYLESYLAHAKTRVRSSTWTRYEGLARTHIVPRIGAVPLAKLRPMHVQAVVDEMIAGGSAPRTTIQAYRVLSAALRQAVRWQLLAVNPANAVSPPRADRERENRPHPDELEAIIRAARGTRLEGPVTIASATGMRLGEVLGLRWRDVDLEQGRLHVSSAAVWTASGFAFVDPKTSRGRREIALPGSLVEWLRRLKVSQAERRLRLGEAWVNHDLVLDTGAGAPIRSDAVSRAFSALMREANLRPFTFHALRHGHAIALLMGGCNPKIVSERLGHSAVSFTMDVYSEVLPAMQAQAAAAIETILGPAMRPA